MLFAAPFRETGRRCQPARLCKEGQPVCGGQQRIVDQAKAQGNAWDTGVVPGHRKMEQNSTIAEEVKVTCCKRVTSKRRVDYGQNHRRKWHSGLSRLEPDRLGKSREDRSPPATPNLHGQSPRRRQSNGIPAPPPCLLPSRET